MVQSAGFYPSRNKATGFTLLEVLVSLAIFAAISAGAFRILQSSIGAHQQSEYQMQQFDALTRILDMMEHDLLQAIDRPIRDSDGDSLAAFVGDSESMQFTHGGWNNRPAEMDSSEPAHATLQRCEYRQSLRQAVRRSHWERPGYRGQTPNQGTYINMVSRQQWNVLDRVVTSTANTTVEIPVHSINFHYLSHNRVWHSRWPATLSNKRHTQSLPLAIKVEMQTARFGLITRLFYVGDKALSDDNS